METLKLTAAAAEDVIAAREGLVDQILGELEHCGRVEITAPFIHGQSLVDLHWAVLRAGRILGQRLQTRQRAQSVVGSAFCLVVSAPAHRARGGWAGS